MMDIKLIFGSLFFTAAILSVSCFSRDLFIDHADDSKQYIQESYADNSTDVTTDGGSGEETSEPITTTPTPTTPTTSRTTTRPPQEVPDISDEVYGIELSLSFNDSCGATPEDCWNLNDTIKSLLDRNFRSHTSDFDFDETLIVDYSFYETGQFYAVEYTVVKYTANYDLATALSNGPQLITEIGTLVFEDLKDETINGSTINEQYLNTVAQGELETAEGEILIYSENLCQYELDNPGIEICEFGQRCKPDEAYNNISFGAVCENKCVSYMVNCDEDEGLCLINDAGNPQCSCKDNTLQISSGTCFHQNYLIFICAVGGGVLIIAVIVLVAVLLHRRRSSGEEDRMSRASAKDILYHERYDADEGQSFQAKQAGRRGSVPSISSAEREPKPGKSNEPPKHRHHRGHHNQSFDWDDNERIRLEDLKDNKRRRDYDPYYTELLESESMKDFKPKLDHIDHNKVYAFRRPMFSSKDGEGSSKKTYASRWEDTD